MKSKKQIKAQLVEFGTAQENQHTLENAVVNIIKTGLKTFTGNTQVDNDLLVRIVWNSNFNQAIPFAIENTYLHNAVTVKVSLDKVFTDLKIKPNSKVKTLTKTQQKYLVGAIIAILGVGDVPQSKWFNATGVMSKDVKDSLRNYGVSVKKTNGKQTFTATDKLLSIADDCIQDLLTIVNVKVSDKLPKNNNSNDDSKRVKIICSVDCKVAQSGVRISVPKDMLSVIGDSLGKCGICKNHFNSVEIATKKTKKKDVLTQADDIIKKQGQEITG